MSAGRRMPNCPSSASKGFSSTPRKSSGGRDILRSRSVEEDLVSSDEDTYSLLSPIYHDSFDSDEDLGVTSEHPQHSDTSRAHSEEPRPTSPDRCELPRRPLDQTLTSAVDPAVSLSLSAWEVWLVRKAKDDRLKLEQQAEEEQLRKEKEEHEERDKQQKRMVVEEKIQEWLKMKRQQEKQEQQQRQSREEAEEERQQEKHRQAERKAQDRYREWLRKKNQEKMEKEKRDKEEADKREEQEKERRRRAEERFKDWLAGAKNTSSPKSSGFPGSPYDKDYPAPSFYNPIPWKPIHVPPAEKPQKKTPRRGPGRVRPQPRYQPGAACRSRGGPAPQTS